MYLRGTLDYGLHLRRLDSLNLVGYYDANWALNPDNRRSIAGYDLYLGPNLIAWNSKKQHIVFKSTTKAEYMSLANLVSEVTLIRSLLTELQVPIVIVLEIWCDNISTLHVTKNLALHARTKHIELDLYFVRENV